MSAPVSDHTADRPDDWAAPGAALVRSAATDPVPALAELGRVHIMGIAGSGMSALARILLERGLAVSGCEARDSITVSGLRALGADVRIGHSPDHLDDADTFVYTTAINPRHEEFVAARASGKRVLRRAAALAAALEDRRTIAVAGTHGKTSTTSLLVVAAQACGADPSFAIGGNLYETGKNAHLGSGDFAVVEADESDGSFLLTRPAVALITNVEADHLENHGSLEGIFRAFEQFVDRVHPAGLLLTCADDAGAQRIAGYAAASGRRVRTYGTHPDADVLVSDIVTSADAVEFSVTGVGTGRRHVRVGALIGKHMALNAAAALTLIEHLGLDLDTAAASWSRFAGVHRRFESHGEAGGVRVYDDYAHHPTEIAASLRAAREALAGGGRLVAVFQPGTYSRTQTFAREFADAMALADIAVVMDIFPAREEPIPGVTGATISDLIELPAGQVVYEPRYDAVPERIAELAQPGDLVVTMGIGNVYLLCDQIRDECGRKLGRRVMTTTYRPDTDVDDDHDEEGTDEPRDRRRRNALIVAACVVVAVLVTWLVAFSPVFGVRTIEVQGNHVASAAQIENAAAIDKGTPLVRLDTDAVARRVERLALVASAQVRTSFPSTVVITVAEREPVGYLRAHGKTMLVDRTGNQYRTVPHPPAGLPRFDVPADADSRTTGGAVATVARALPAALLARIDVIHALDPSAITLVLTGGRTVAWGSAAASVAKARVLPALLKQPGDQIDVTDPQQPFTR